MARPPGRAASDRDLLYFFAETFRARLVKELPASREHASRSVRQFSLRAKALLVELAEISLECAQLVMAADEEGKPVLPTWFLVEVTRDLPRRTGEVPENGVPHGLDDFYRRALSGGFAYHQQLGRGLVPAGLAEEIRVLEHPPPWDVELARWFDRHFRPLERVRSYARASRRQASTPDIPRPGRLRPLVRERDRTFGVVLDTSGSMPPALMGKALGAIASYAAARDVPAARMVFCDAVAYDAGYLAVEDIAGRVKVRGRGGTMLQPGIDLLERAVDFPASGPILIITDGYCDVLRVRREHAYLIPRGSRLPFAPKGEVFRFR